MDAVAAPTSFHESLISLSLSDIRAIDNQAEPKEPEASIEDDKEPSKKEEFTLIVQDAEQLRTDVPLQVQLGTRLPSSSTTNFADYPIELIDSNSGFSIEDFKNVRKLQHGTLLDSTNVLRAKPTVEADRNANVHLRAKDYFDLADHRLREVGHRIEHMASGRKAQWNQYQIELAEADSQTKQESVRSARNIEFPEIASELEGARRALETGKNESFFESIESQLGTEATASIRRHIGAGSGKQSEANGLNETAVLPELEILGTTGKKEPSRLDRPPLSDPFEQLTNVYRSSGAEEEFLNRRPEAPLFPRPSIQVDLFHLHSQQRANWRGPIEKAKTTTENRTETRLAEFDRPGLTQLVDLRLQRMCEKIVDEDAKNAVTSSFERIARNPNLSEREKIETLQQFERLVQDSDAAVASMEERLLLASQMGLQVDEIARIDQGHFKTCNLSVVEKMMSSHHTNLLARMIADVALTGETRAASGRLIKLDPRSLRPADEAALSLHTDGERSLISQYFAQIGADIRFQLFNEKFGTSLKYALLNGDERVMDFSGSEPMVVYDLDLDSGKITLEPKPELLKDGRRMVDATLQPCSTEPLDSPKMRAADILDLYAEMSGRKTDTTLLIHYEMAAKEQNSGLHGIYERFMESERPLDKRQQLYRNGDELEVLLRKAKFPVLFAEPGHITTINSFERTSRKSDYDNQWGQKHDMIGANGLTPDELVKKGFDINEIIERRNRKTSRQLELREQYEKWCADTGVEVDVRYPTKAEVEAWRKGIAQ